MYKKILVPFDDSESSHHALREAIELAAGSEDTQVTVLKVVEWHDYNAETFKIASRMSDAIGDSMDASSISEVDSEATSEEAERILQSISPIIGPENSVEIAVANGSPHDAIVAFADDNDFDCIIMGHRGMGVIRGMLGSVAFSVLQKANKPVLVVK